MRGCEAVLTRGDEGVTQGRDPKEGEEASLRGAWVRGPERRCSFVARAVLLEEAEGRDGVTPSWKDSSHLVLLSRRWGH